MSSPRELPPELDRIAEEFVERARKGEHPSIDEYVQRYPDYEDGIREVFPLLSAIEGAKPPSGSGSLGRVAKGVDPEIKSLGDHRLIRVIGRGGMGVVYEAEEETLGRRVALKVLPPRSMLDPRFVERFRIEAQAAARLQHPHIVPVIGLGEADGVHYYTMQFIDGCGLDEILEDTQLLLDSADERPRESVAGSAVQLFTMDLTAPSSSVGSTPEARTAAKTSPPTVSRPASRASRRRYYRNVAQIGLQSAEALAYAHAHGVLHRDVKPSNILLDERGRAWITDFGLCRDDSAEGVTQTGDLVGTLRYMAPEGFSGEHDVRGDVYGLGLTLYELLAVGPAFEDADKATLVRKITQEAPPKLKTRDPHVPTDLATIVQKAIAPDPTVRYQTADALVADLRAYLDGRPIAARAPSVAYLVRAAVRRNRPLAIAVLVATILVVASSVFYVLSLKEKEKQARVRLYAASFAAAETALRDGDGPRAAGYLEEAPPEFRNWEWRHLRSRVDQSVRSFPSLSPDIARHVRHSPDGKWLAVAGSKGISIFADETGERVGLLAQTWTLCMAWSPDGTRLVVGTYGDNKLTGKVPTYGKLVVWSWPAGERVLERMWADRPHALAYTPDGARLFVGSEDTRVSALDAETLDERAHVGLGSHIMSIAVSRDGRRAVVGLQDGHVALLDTTNLNVAWTAAAGSRSTEGVTFIGNDLVAASTADGAVRVFRSSNGALHRILPHDANIIDVAGSRSGMVATLETSGRLHVWDASSGERRYAPRSHGRFASEVCFHPDGTRVVTASFAGTVKEWDVSAGRDAQVCSRHLDAALTVAVHPAGRLVASGGTGGILRLWDLDTGEAVRVLPGHAASLTGAAFSPNGEHLATADKGDVATILIRRADDGAIARRIETRQGDISRIAYTPDSRTLIAIGYDGRLSVWNPDLGESVKQLEVSAKPLLALSVSPNGKQVAVAGADRKILVFDTATWTIVDTLEGHTDEVRGVAFHPEGDLLASVSADETIRVWNVSSGASLSVMSKRDADMAQHTEVIQDVTFHPDGSRLVTGDRSANIDVWDWERGQLMSTLRGHDGWVHRVAFSGERLVSCASDGTVRIWGTQTAADQTPTLREARRLRELARPIVENRLARTDDLDRVIATLTADIELQPDLREAALRLAFARWGTRAELKRWLWRVFTPPTGDEHTRYAARALARAFLRSSEIRHTQDAEGTLLTGIAHYRVGHRHSRYFMIASIQLNTNAPDLQATALAFLVMSYATTDGRVAEADEHMAQLEAHLAAHPDALTERVGVFVREAKTLYAQMPR